MNFKDTIKKLVITMLLCTIIFISFPHNAKAGAPTVDSPNLVPNSLSAGSNVGTFLTQLKDALIESGKAILKSIAKKLLTKLTRDMVNWINGGFEGKPMFLEDPKGFFTDIRNTEIKGIISLIGYDPIKYPFGRDLAISMIEDTKDYFAQNAQYSLDQYIGGEQNRIEFQGNFNLGGWDAYAGLARPNNNRFGSQLLLNQYTSLKVKLNADVSDKASAVQKEIELGKGFLSPKKCIEPADYEPEPSEGFVYNGDGTSDDYNLLYAEYTRQHTCTKEEITTPGGLVSDQISLALGSKYRQSELGQAVGSSLSMIFDALFNKLVDEGLSALGDAISTSPQQPDTFNYQGYSFSANTGTSTQGNGLNTADIVVDVTKFRKEISDSNPDNPGAIERTTQTLGYQSDLLSTLKSLPSAVRALDMCTPGPDRYWETRLDKEFRRETKKIEKKSDSKNVKKSAKATRALRALEYSIKEFKNYITVQMIVALPSSSLFMEEVDKFQDYEGDLDRATKQKLDYKTIIAKLNSIKTVIDDPAMNPDPVTGLLTVAQESVIKMQYKRYLALRASIPTDDVVDQKESELNKLEEKKTRIQNLTTSCLDERTGHNWGPPNPKGLSDKTDVQNPDGTNAKEIELLCGWPMNGGYSYGDASDGLDSDDTGNGTTVYSGDDADEGDSAGLWILEGTHLEGDGTGYDIPIVNAPHVYKRFLSNISIDIRCDFVFPTTLLDYQQEDQGVY